MKKKANNVISVIQEQNHALKNMYLLFPITCLISCYTLYKASD